MKILFLLMHTLFLSSISDDKEISVYVFVAEECPICNYMGKTLSAIAADYKDNVQFYLVFPLKKSNYKTVHLFKEKYHLGDYQSILDKDQTLTRKLGATVTPEVVITSDENSNILYRGRISDAYAAPGKIRHRSRSKDLRVALEKVLEDQKIAQPWPDAVGCFITFDRDVR